MVRAVLTGQEELCECVAEKVDLLGEETREMILLDSVVGLDVQHLLSRLLRSEERGREVNDMKSSTGRLAAEADGTRITPYGAIRDDSVAAVQMRLKERPGIRQQFGMRLCRRNGREKDMYLNILRMRQCLSQPRRIRAAARRAPWHGEVRFLHGLRERHQEVPYVP